MTMRDQVPWLPYVDVTNAEDAGWEMWHQDFHDLGTKQAKYEVRRAEKAKQHRDAAHAFIEKAAGEKAPRDRDRYLALARQELQNAADPLPKELADLRRTEGIVIRSCGRPAVLVRSTNPFQREKYHGGPECGLIGGEGRRLEDARWIPIGEALAIGHEPCSRCNPSA